MYIIDIMSNHSLKSGNRKKFHSHQFSEKLKKNCDSPRSAFQPTRPMSVVDDVKHTSPEPLFLNKIRKRKISETTPEISTEMAVEVIKDYLLPMFRYDSKNKRDKKRSELFGISPKKDLKKLEVLPGSVYAELKLSEHLAYENKEMVSKIKEFDIKYRKIQQENLTIADEHKKLQQDFNNLQTEYNSLSYLYQTSISVATNNQQSY